MEIFGLEKVSFVDYEGYVCATVFTGGCNFMCPFCHNAGLVFKKTNMITEEYVLEYLQGRKKLLDAITISGGEPTLQKDLRDFILKVKNMGYKIKLDTNGTMPGVLQSLIDENLLDYVAIDIKTDFDNYPQITGLNINLSEKVKRSLKILKKASVKYELRTTLVKEYHSVGNIEKLKDELCNEEILYLQKFVDSGSCIRQKLNPIPKKEALEYRDILKKRIQNVYLRGYS